MKRQLCSRVLLLITCAGALQSPSWAQQAPPVQVKAPDAQSAQTAPIDQRRIDDYILAEMERQGIPGLALAIVQSGRVVKLQGYGYANLEHKAPVKAETIFQSGSLGKQFTASAVMMLVEAGKVQLDAPISQYLGPVPESWKPITVRHLLTHTSGLTDYPKDFDLRKDTTEAELLKMAQSVSLAFKPGESWQYSNLGYVTLGILISKVSGIFYGDFLQEHAFGPSGMKTTRIISEADLIPNRAAGYQLVEGQIKNQDWVAPSLNTTGDGALYLSILDLAQWDAALYSESPLKQSSLTQMWTPVKLNNGQTAPYGFGWVLRDVRGHRLVEHGGAWQGFRSHMARFVDDKLTFIVLANLLQADPSRIAHGVAGLYKPELAPEPPKAIEDKEPEVTRLVKDLISSFVASKPDPKLFTPDLQAAIFPDQVKAISEYFKAKGTLQRIELLKRHQQGNRRAYRYRLVYPNEQLWLDLDLDKEGKIVMISFDAE